MLNRNVALHGKAEAENGFMAELSGISSRINENIIWALINNEHDKNINALYRNWMELSNLICTEKGEL